MYRIFYASTALALLLIPAASAADAKCLSLSQARERWPDRHVYWYHNDDGARCWSNRRGAPLADAEPSRPVKHAADSVLVNKEPDRPAVSKPPPVASPAPATAPLQAPFPSMPAPPVAPNPAAAMVPPPPELTPVEAARARLNPPAGLDPLPVEQSPLSGYHRPDPVEADDDTGIWPNEIVQPVSDAGFRALDLAGWTLLSWGAMLVLLSVLIRVRRWRIAISESGRDLENNA